MVKNLMHPEHRLSLFKIKYSDLRGNNLIVDSDKPNHISIQPGTKMTPEEFNLLIQNARNKWEYVPPK